MDQTASNLEGSARIPEGVGVSRLLTLEVGRFLAALMVALFHFTSAFRNIRGEIVAGDVFREGHAGVEYFFVLSGFIMHHVHQRDFGRPSRVVPFALKRAIRLAPLFWTVFAVTALLSLFVATIAERAPGDVVHLLLDVLLLPSDAPSLVGVSWTLRNEVVFYLLFAILIARPGVGVIAIGVWQAGSLAIGLVPGGASLSAIQPVFYVYNLGFALGMLASWAWPRLRLAPPAFCAAGGAALFIADLAVDWALHRGEPIGAGAPAAMLSPLVHIVGAAAMIFGLAQWEAKRVKALPAWLGPLGGASYALYLVHGLVGSTVIRAFGFGPLQRVPPLAVLAAMAVSAVAAAILVHQFYERPLIRALQRRLTRRSPPTVGATLQKVR